MDEAQVRLGFLSWKQGIEQYRMEKRKRKAYPELLLESYQQLHNRTPEELVIEKENQEELLEFISKVKEIIGPKSFEILWLSAVEGWTQDRIAERFSVKQQTINEHLQRITQRLSSDPSLQYARVLLQKPPSTLEAHSPEHQINYPSDFLQRVSIAGKWRGKKYQTKTICKIPEMLRECFQDHKTVCPRCFDDFGVNSCSRKDII